MEKKIITCIECPQGCRLELDIEGGRVIKISGNKCNKGEKYGKQEIENPLRTLTSTVLCIGLDLKLLPVKTSAPIPKDKILEAANELRKIKINRTIKAGEILQKNFVGLGVDLIATRSAVKNP